jgi:hypothetical protein
MPPPTTTTRIRPRCASGWVMSEITVAGSASFNLDTGGHGPPDRERRRGRGRERGHQQGLPIVVSRESAEYQKLLAVLDKERIRAQTVFRDRGLIADAFFAKTEARGGPAAVVRRPPGRERAREARGNRPFNDLPCARLWGFTAGQLAW